MIKVRCFSNHDDLHNKTWPEAFLAVPNKGDYVRSVGGSTGARIAKVCGITHCVDSHGPYIEVELTVCHGG